MASRNKLLAFFIAWYGWHEVFYWALFFCGGKPGIVPQEIKGWWVRIKPMDYPQGKPSKFPKKIKRGRV